MKRFFPLAFILVACSPTSEVQPKHSEPAVKAPFTQTTPSPIIDPSINPDRVFQLKDLKKVEMTVKGKPIHAWVMDDDSKTQEGMMFLKDKDVKADEGMLFVFPTVQKKLGEDGQPRGFWMHNTLIPLDIVFMSPKGQVLNVGHGKVQDDTTVPSQGDFQYVLELKAGTAATLGLKAGDSIAIPKL